MDEVGLVAEMGSGAGRREWRVRFNCSGTYSFNII